MKLVFSVATLLLIGCAQNISVERMQLCSQEEENEIDGPILNEALKKASSWAKEKYGNDCVTCAEIYGVEEESFRLHITSPGDLLINTSAMMEFRRKDAKVIDSGMYHSCYVHYVER